MIKILKRSARMSSKKYADLDAYELLDTTNIVQDRWKTKYNYASALQNENGFISYAKNPLLNNIHLYKSAFVDVVAYPSIALNGAKQFVEWTEEKAPKTFICGIANIETINRYSGDLIRSKFLS